MLRYLDVQLRSRKNPFIRLKIKQARQESCDASFWWQEGTYQPICWIDKDIRKIDKQNPKWTLSRQDLLPGPRYIRASMRGSGSRGRGMLETSESDTRSFL